MTNTRRCGHNRKFDLGSKGNTRTIVSHSATTCPVCGAMQTGSFATKGQYSLSRCGECTLAYAHPRPSRNDVFALYTRDSSSISELHFPKAKAKLRHAMLRAARLSRYVWGRDAIDIGCGGGFMVEAMRRFRARAVGLDINAKRIAFASRNFPGNRFFCENLEEFPRHEMKFDFIFSSQVLEHVHDFDDFMGALGRISRPGGFVYLKTPDRDHWRVRQDLASEDTSSPPISIQFFNKASIRILLERHGFEVKKVFFKVKPTLHVLAQRT